MKKHSLTHAFLLSVLILSIAFTAFALSLAFVGSEQAVADTLPRVCLVDDNGNELVHTDDSKQMVSVLRGKNFDVHLMISGYSDGISSIEIDINYDPTVMTLSNYTQSGTAFNEMEFRGTTLFGPNGKNERPLQFVWNAGTNTIYPENPAGDEILTISFTTNGMLTEELISVDQCISLSYRAANTFRNDSTTGRIKYQSLNVSDGYFRITEGAYLCTWYDHDGRMLKRLEEDENHPFSYSDSLDPDHPDRESDNCYYYVNNGWKSVNRKEGLDVVGFKYDITALYTPVAQPYTIYYYFYELDAEGEIVKVTDPDTGEVVDDLTSPLYYYYVYSDDEPPTKIYHGTDESIYGAETNPPVNFTEAFYSVSGWYTAPTFSTKDRYGEHVVFEDTSVTLPAGTYGKVEDTFSIKLYAYKQRNEEIQTPENIDEFSTIRNDVTVSVETGGIFANVDVNLVTNKSIMSMTLTLDLDEDSPLTLIGFREETIAGVAFSHTSTETEEGYNIRPFRFLWSSGANFTSTGTILHLRFKLPDDIAPGSYKISFTYREKIDVTKYYADPNGNEASSKLWYTNLHIIPGTVCVQEVTMPTATTDTYVYDKDVTHIYRFASEDAVSKDHYIVSNDTRKDSTKGPGQYTQYVTVALKTGDNFYRYWVKNGARTQEQKYYAFDVERREIAAPVAHSGKYYYNAGEQIYTFNSTNDAAYYHYEDETKFRRTEVGAQNIVCVLDDKINTYWTDSEDTTDRSYEFRIYKGRVTMPTPSVQTYTFDSTEQTFAFSDYGATDYYTITEGTDKRYHAGEQDVECTLDDPAHYCWDWDKTNPPFDYEWTNEDEPIDALDFLFTIEKRSITAPIDLHPTYTYKGTPQEYAFGAQDALSEPYYTITGNEPKTDAGKYPVTVSLKSFCLEGETIDFADTYWGENVSDTAAKVYYFVIDPRQVTAPAPCADSFTFDTKSHSYIFASESEADKSCYTVSGILEKSSSGTTPVTISLNNEGEQINYVWSTGGHTDIVYDFTVAKKSVVKPAAQTYDYIYNGTAYEFKLAPRVGVNSNYIATYYKKTNTSRTNAGSYLVSAGEGATYELAYPADTYWGENASDTAAVSFDFVIVKAQVTKPTLSNVSYTYNGAEQTYTFRSFDTNQYYVKNPEAVKQTNANEAGYSIYVRLKNPDNYAWEKENNSDPLSSDDYEVKFVISRKTIIKPSLSETNYSFDAAGITPVYSSAPDLDSCDLTVIKGGETSELFHVGAYTLRFTLKNANYCWSGQTTAPVELTVNVNTRIVPIPVPQVSNIYLQTAEPYTGSAQSYVFASFDAESPYYSCENNSFIDAGEHPIEVTLTYPDDTQWDKPAEAEQYTLYIPKQKVDTPLIADKTYSEDENHDPIRQYGGLTETPAYKIHSDLGGTVVGSYFVTIELKSTNYEWKDVAYANVTQMPVYYRIVQAANSWKSGPSITDVPYGDSISDHTTAEPAYGTISSVEYRKNDTESTDEDYSATPPTAVGAYKARFTVEGDANHDGLVTEILFDIVKKVYDLSGASWVLPDLVYSGEEKTVTVTGIPNELSYELSENKATEVGDYTARIAFDYDEDSYTLKYASFTDTKGFSITPLARTVVWTADTSFTPEYRKSGYSDPTAYFTDVKGEKVYLAVTEKEGKSILGVGTYTFNAAFDERNYSVNASDLTRMVTVSAKKIARPSANTTVFVYNGSSQTYSLENYGFDSTWMNYATDTAMQNAGSKVIEIVLTDANTCWADDMSTTSAKYTFEIEKATVVYPTASANGTLAFTGGEQTYVFASEYGDKTLYTVSGTTRTQWGEQPVTITLNDAANYRWAGTSNSDATASDPIEYTFTITKQSVAIPTAIDKTYIYNGTNQTCALANWSDAWMTAKNRTMSDAGTYTVEISLRYPNDTYWGSNESDTDVKTVSFTIEKQTVLAPTETKERYVFNAKAQKYLFGEEKGDSRLYEVKNSMCATAEEHIVTVSLKAPQNYRWAGTSNDDATASDPIEYSFVIEKLSVASPTAPERTYVYDGKPQTYVLDEFDADWMFSRNRTVTDAGGYTVGIGLTYPNDTYWDADPEDAADKTFSFVIEKKPVTPPTATTQKYVYTGKEQTYLFADAGESDFYGTSSLKAKSAGSTEIKVNLNSSTNYRWADKTNDDATASDERVYPFVIDPASVSIPAADTTAFVCTGEDQTYAIAPSDFYSVSGATKHTHGNSKVVVSLKNEGNQINYVWSDGTTADIEYDFTIEHSFTVKDYSAVADAATCDSPVTYYYVCKCGQVGTEKYASEKAVDKALGHEYAVEFDWSKYEYADGTVIYYAAEAHIFCKRGDVDRRESATVTCSITPAGKSNGSKVYTASVTIDGRDYTEDKVVTIKAIGRDYSEPEWSWTYDERGEIKAVATFTDSDMPEITKDVTATVDISDNGDDTYTYTATAIFNGSEYYADSQIKEKPTLTFVDEDNLFSKGYRVCPGNNITSYFLQIPTPEKDDAEFLMWQTKDGIALLLVDGDTHYYMPSDDVVFYAVWKSVGQIVVSVTNKETEASFEGCVVELKKGDVTVAKKMTGASGEVSFSDCEYGNYSVVVTYTDGSTVTYTTGAVLGNAQTKVDVTLSEKHFNTSVQDTTGKNISVENLEKTISEKDKENIVTTGEDGTVEEISIVFRVKEEEDETVITDMSEAVTTMELELLDLSNIVLEKTVKVVNGEDTVTYLKNSDTLVNVTIPITDDIYAALAKNQGTVENILVVRKGEGASVESMIKYSPAAALAGETECFYVTKKDGVSYINFLTSTFSTTYGLCVSPLPIGTSNKIITFDVEDWTYGEDHTDPTATAEYGTPVIKYRLQTDLEWTTGIPTKAGEYWIMAEVEETSEYKGCSRTESLTIHKATYDTASIKFEDVTVVYDGQPHKIVVSGTLPEGVTPNYAGNGQVDVGTYTIKVTFTVDPNYEPIPEMSAVLTIVDEETSDRNCLFSWILIAIAIIETIFLILLFVQGKKYKKKYEEEKEKKELREKKDDSVSLSALCMCSFMKLSTLNLCFLVLDIVLLGLIVWRFFVNRKYKKAWKALLAENEAAANAQETSDKEGEKGNEDAPQEDASTDRAEE